MAKFHINKHGVPAPCKAKIGNCPLGGEESHFNTQEEAQEHADIKSKEEFGLLVTTSSKDNSKEKLQKLVDNMGTETVIDELSYTLSTDELENVVDEIISQHDLEDYVNRDNQVRDQLEEVKEVLKLETILSDMTQILSSKQLHESIELIEDNIDSEEEEDEWMAFKDEHDEKILENDIEVEPRANYEKQLNELEGKLNKHTKQLIEEVEQWLDDTEK